MITQKADFFEFNSTNNDGAESRSTAGGGGAGKSSLGDLTFVKYTEFAGDIDELTGSSGGEGVTAALLLPAVQSVREARRPTAETAFDELQTFAAAQTWDDHSLG